LSAGFLKEVPGRCDDVTAQRHGFALELGSHGATALGAGRLGRLRCLDQRPDDSQLVSELSAGAAELGEQVLSEHPDRSLAVKTECVPDAVRVSGKRTGQLLDAGRLDCTGGLDDAGLHVSGLTGESCLDLRR
jgi:hypothetical protein